jgi:hypothetical protein
LSGGQKNSHEAQVRSWLHQAARSILLPVHPPQAYLKVFTLSKHSAPPFVPRRRDVLMKAILTAGIVL